MYKSLEEINKTFEDHRDSLHHFEANGGEVDWPNFYDSWDEAAANFEN